jgi:hypothetical protein
VTFTFFDALTGGNAREEIKDNLGLKFFLDDQAEAFRGTGSTPTYDVKALIRGLVFSEYFRASRVQGQSLAQTKYRNHGTARLLPPELLARKIRENFDDVIRANRLNAIASELEKPSALGLAYGGTRYTDESDRNSEMNPFMANIQLKVAADLACAIVKEEFSKPQSERKIFKEVELDTEFTSPEDPNLVNMALAVGRVYERMSVPWGFFAIGPAQVIWLETEEAVSIFDVPGACRPNTGVSRKNTLKWMAVLTYALADYYVFHQ